MSNQCKSCDSYNSVDYYLYEIDNTCVKVCPSGYANDKATTNPVHKCVSCKICATCDSNDYTKCLSCN